MIWADLSYLWHLLCSGGRCARLPCHLIQTDPTTSCSLTSVMLVYLAVFLNAWWAWWAWHTDVQHSLYLMFKTEKKGQSCQHAFEKNIYTNFRCVPTPPLWPSTTLSPWDNSNNLAWVCPLSMCSIWLSSSNNDLKSSKIHAMQLYFSLLPIYMPLLLFLALQHFIIGDPLLPSSALNRYCKQVFLNTASQY